MISKNLAIISIFRVIHGAAFGVSGTIAVSLASDYVPNDRLGEGIGYLGLGQVLASAVVPGFGIIIADHIGMPIAFLISCIMAIIGATLLIVCGPKHTASVINKREKAFGLKNLIAKEAILFTIISGVFSIINGVVASFLLLFSEERHVENISAYFMISALFLLIIRPLSGIIMDKKGISVLVYPSIAIGAAAMVMHGLSTALWMFLVAAVLRAIAQGCIQPTLQTACLKKVGKDRSGVATSTFYLGADVGQGIGPIINVNKLSCHNITM